MTDTKSRTAEMYSAVDAAMDDIRAIEATLGVTSAGVDAIKTRLLELATLRHLFDPVDFPPPTPEEENASCAYRISQDDDDRFALYLNTTGDEWDTPPHNHTTWAVVVGIHGDELNRFYEKTDDGGVVEVHQHVVNEGTGIAMLPDDIHSIHVRGGSLNFHCYGLALENLDRREYYVSDTGEWKVFAGVADIREARQGCK